MWNGRRKTNQKNIGGKSLFPTVGDSFRMTFDWEWKFRKGGTTSESRVGPDRKINKGGFEKKRGR